MAGDLDPVFKALADPTRRRLLDLLKERPRTTGELCEAFPRLSRFAVMKHLAVLVRARLVLVRRRGRERWNYLNATPLRRIYERWVSGYAAYWATQLSGLKQAAERPPTSASGTPPGHESVDGTDPGESRPMGEAGEGRTET